MQNHERYDWKRLKGTQRLGKYAEYFVKMECTLYDFDVYSAEVDDKGIDFVIRKAHDKNVALAARCEYFDIQVKSVRDYNYMFFRKKHFEPRPNLLAAVVYFHQKEAPKLFLIPSTEWERKPHPCFADRDFEGKKSDPEYGLSVTPNTFHLLAEYSYDKMLTQLSSFTHQTE